MCEGVYGEGHGMADAPELAAGLRDVGPLQSDVEQALVTLRRKRRFTVEVAYAYARRRDIEPAWRRAADLLELSLAERDHRAFRAPPKWARAEVMIRVMFAFVLVVVGAQLWLGDPEGSWYAGTGVWLLLPLIWWYTVRRDPDRMRAVAADTGEIERRLGRVLEEGRAMADDGATIGELAATLRRIAGGDGDPLEARMAAVVLSRVQHRLAPTRERHRETLLDASDRARRQQLQRLGLTQHP
jgi:hypothetical protein